jgi:lysophospholipase
MTKLSYLIGRGYKPKQVEAMMREDMRGELTPIFARPFSYKPVHIVERIIATLATHREDGSGEESATIPQPDMNSSEVSFLERSFFPLLLCSAAGHDDLDALKLLKEGLGYLSINSLDYDRRTALVSDVSV